MRGMPELTAGPVVTTGPRIRLYSRACRFWGTVPSIDSEGRSLMRQPIVRSAIIPVLLIAALSAGCSESSTSSGASGQGSAQSSGQGASAQGGAAQGARPPAQAGFITIRPQPVELSSTVAGRVTAYQTAEIRPQVNGLIRERVFREGSEVKQGDVLYRIDPQSYQAEVTAAQASLQKAQAAEATAKASADRYNRLSDTNVVSQQDRENAQSTFLQAQADVAVAQANLQTAQINLGYTTITAPISGQISTSTVNAGSLVTANQTNALATIRQIDPVYVDMSESAGNLLRFREQLQTGALRLLVGPGKEAKVNLTFADGSAYAGTGTINAADRYVSETTGTFSVRSTFDNPQRELLPGMYVRASVNVAVAENGFLVPQRAVSRNNKGEATARFIKADDTVETRVITTQSDIGSNWLVSAGVSDGDRLVIDGLQSVQDGQKVTPVEVQINEDGTAKVAANEAAPAPAAGQATEQN